MSGTILDKPLQRKAAKRLIDQSSDVLSSKRVKTLGSERSSDAIIEKVEIWIDQFSALVSSVAAFFVYDEFSECRKVGSARQVDGACLKGEIK